MPIRRLAFQEVHEVDVPTAGSLNPAGYIHTSNAMAKQADGVILANLKFKSQGEKQLIILS